MLELLGFHLKELTIRDYVCSNCWGDLLDYPMDNRMWMVICHSCREDTRGYVTRYFAESRRSESVGEKMETRILLQGLGIIPNEHAGKSAAELLQELGF